MQQEITALNFACFQLQSLGLLVAIIIRPFTTTVSILSQEAMKVVARQKLVR